MLGPRQLLAASFLIVFAATASGQCYQFTSTGPTLRINISSIVVWTGPTATPGGGFLSSGFFSSTNSFTSGGATLTSQAVYDGAASIRYSPATSGGPPAYTNLTIGVPTNQADTLTASYEWEVTLFGAGNLIPSGTLPQTLPTISQWVYQTAEEVIGVISGPAASPTTALYTITAVTGCSATAPDSSDTGKTLGDTSSSPGGCNCGNPIDIGSGNKFETAVDYKTAGGNTLSFIRYYNSLPATGTLAAALGSNWRSNYDRYLRLSSTSVIAERADGQQLTFTLTGSTWTPDTDVDVTLTNSGATWTLTDHDDTVETYLAVGASEGLLQSVQARNGYTQSLAYNSANQLLTVTDSFQRALAFTYNSSLLTSVTTPDGLMLTFAYTGNNLTSVGYSTSPPTTVTYLYENAALPSALTGIIDENGNRYATWTYDSTGRGLTSQHAGGAGLTTVAYNDTDGSRTVTGPLGQQAVYHFTTMQNVPKITELDFVATSTTPAKKMTYTYDSNGFTASRTDWNGNLTTFVNNVHGLPTTIVEASGSPQARTTTVTYHPTFRLPLQIVMPGVTASFTYDNSGEPLTITLTDTTTGASPYSTSGQTRTWTYTWSNFLLASAKGPRTDVAALTKFTYDASGALTSIANALNQVIQVTKHLPGGRPLAVVDRNNVTTTFTYDARQHLLTSSIAAASGPLTSKLSYDSAENLLTITLPDGSAFTNSYDGAHRLIGTADLLGDSVNYTLDASGDRTLTAAKDPSASTKLQRSATYDALGRALQTTGGAGQTSSFSYDLNGNATSITDGLNHTRQQAFDALNRIITITDPAKGITSIAYDSFSRPLNVTDPNGAVTQYTYDGFGDLIQELSPTSGATVYHYDAAGNLTQRIDARGVVTNYAYDALNRRTSVTYPGNTAENVTLTYDQGAYGIGKLTSVADAAGTLSRSYDVRGNLLSEVRTRGNATLTTSYTYDPASRLASITYPSHWSVAYTRDGVGRVTAVTATPPTGGSKALLSSVAYLPVGPINAMTYGNGIAETRTFDADYRLTRVSSSVQNLAYGYDAADNALSIGDGINSANSQSFGYDALHRLTTASGEYGSLGYNLDSNGNRVSETSPASSDGLGSVSAFSYNQEGRLSGASAGSQTLTQYTYDAFGHRVVKVGSVTATTLYQYGPGGLLLEESDGQGNPQVDYVYLGAKPVATIQADGSLHFLHDDRLGTPQVATDSTQAVAWSITYQPFGLIANPPALIAQDLRLPGQESDQETGLNHNGFRDYAPGSGRYLESDPLGLGGGTNRYSYAGGNPVGSSDRPGLAVDPQTEAALILQSQRCQSLGQCMDPAVSAAIKAQATAPPPVTPTATPTPPIPATGLTWPQQPGEGDAAYQLRVCQNGGVCTDQAAALALGQGLQTFNDGIEIAALQSAVSTLNMTATVVDDVGGFVGIPADWLIANFNSYIQGLTVPVQDQINEIKSDYSPAQAIGAFQQLLTAPCPYAQQQQ